jgi:hypothetical protein
MRSIVIALVLIVVLCLWYASRLGLVGLFGEGRRDVVWSESVPLAMDVVVGGVAIALGFVLSVWRVTRDRSGRHSMSLLSRLGDAWERWQTARWSIPSRPLASPADAYETFVFRSRAIAVPATIVTVLAMAWIAALFVGAISRNLGNLLEVALLGCWVAAFFQILTAAAVAILSQLYSSRWLTPPAHSVATYSTRFFETLPISNRDLAGAALRASITAMTLSMVLITGSLALVGFISRITDTKVNLLNSSGGEFAGGLLIMTFGSALISFVLVNIPFAILAFAAKRAIVLAAIVAFGISFLFRFPLSLSLGGLVLVWLLAEMVFFTVLSLRRGDVTPRSAVLIWGAGVTLAVVFLPFAWTGFTKRLQAIDHLTFAFEAALLILPFLATSVAVRKFRAS